MNNGWLGSAVRFCWSELFDGVDLSSYGTASELIPAEREARAGLLGLLPLDRVRELVGLPKDVSKELVLLQGADVSAGQSRTEFALFWFKQEVS